MNRRMLFGAAVALLIGLGGAAQAQDVREFTFGYDQPKSTAYGFAGDLFEEQIAKVMAKKREYQDLLAQCEQRDNNLLVLAQRRDAERKSV